MIDVLMPFHGDVGLLRQAARSVVEQEGTSWRLIVVDDAHPDDAARQAIIELAHPQVTYVRNEERLGVSGNFRRCLELASADHVVFMGCDDLMLPGYVASMEDAIQRFPSAAMLQPRVRVIDTNGHSSRPIADRVKQVLMPRVDVPVLIGGERLARSLLRGNWCYFPAICWRRDLVAAHPFRADMETVLDLDLILHLVLDGQQFALLPDETFAYRRHPASASSRTARDSARFEEESRLFREISQLCRRRGWKSAERAARRHITSRLHAALLVPAALGARDWRSANAMVRHVVGGLSH